MNSEVKKIFLILSYFYLQIYGHTFNTKSGANSKRLHKHLHQSFSLSSFPSQSPDGDIIKSDEDYLPSLYASNDHKAMIHKSIPQKLSNHKSFGHDSYYSVGFDPPGEYNSKLLKRVYPRGNSLMHPPLEAGGVITQTPLDVAEGRTWENPPNVDEYGGAPMATSSTKDPSIPENPVGLKNPSLLLGPWEEIPDVRDTEASFKGVNGSRVTAQVGTTANISCVVMNRGDHETVSWIRLRDHHLITVGRQTYSRDERFSVSYNRHSNEWILHLRYVQPRDAGKYLCQVSTHPPMVFVKTLSITEASASIEGGPERIVEGGSIVKLNCSLRHHSQPPEYVFWYHNRTMINFDLNRQIKVENTKDGSILTLESVTLRDSGNYTCVPYKAQQASVMLHVILDDAPAAMQVSSSLPVTSHLVQMPFWATFFIVTLL